MRERIKNMNFAKFERRRSIKGKPFNILDDEEKKLRIQYLWDRIRMYIALKRTIKSVQDDVEKEYIRKMMKMASIVNEEDETLENESEKLAWYLLNREWTSIIIWELIFSFVVMFNMFTVPLMIAFPKNMQANMPLWFELLLEIMWLA